MEETAVTRFAVAMLMETPDTGGPFRNDPTKPLHGYCLISDDGQDCRVSLYLENGRTLTSRSPAELFYYEAWLVTDSEPVSLGALNMGPSGDGVFTCTHSSDRVALPEAVAVRLTAEPFGGTESGGTAVLGGRVVWMAGQPEIDVDPDLEMRIPAAIMAIAEPADTAEATMVADRDHPLPVDMPPELDVTAAAEVDATSAAAVSPPSAADEAASPSRDGSGLWSDLVPADELLPDLHADWPTPPSPEAVLEAEAAPISPASEAVDPTDVATLEQLDSPLITEPPAPVPDAEPYDITPHRSQDRITLESKNALAPRASGTASLDAVSGELVLNLRGLPSPAALGRDSQTDRPFNTYRVWLYSQRAGTRIPIGVAGRVWGDNFQFQGISPQPFSRYDAVMVTADDRSAISTGASGPLVLLGSYRL